MPLEECLTHCLTDEVPPVSKINQTHTVHYELAFLSHPCLRMGPKAMVIKQSWHDGMFG